MTSGSEEVQVIGTDIPPIPEPDAGMYACEFPALALVVSESAYLEQVDAARIRDDVLTKLYDYAKFWEDECGRERGRNVDLEERIEELEKALSEHQYQVNMVAQIKEETTK